MEVIMDIKLVKKLREETGAGMLDCKKALEEANGKYENAQKILLEQSTKNQGNTRVASKGLCSVVINQNEAILFEVNAETDFVAKNDHFKVLIKDLGDQLIRTKVTNQKDALKVDIDGMTVQQKIDVTSSLIKENAQLRRFYRVIKSDNQSFGSYVHLGGKIVTLVILDGNNDLIANDLAMQVAANSPLYLDPKTIDIDTINYEKFMYEKEHKIFDQIGFDTHLNSICLSTQPYIKNPEKTIADLVISNQLTVLDFFRFELGQGIENKLNCKLDIPCDGSQITVTPIY